MKPKVSVIITIYNREKYIEKCARSLFEQTLDKIEFVFIDDASKDESLAQLSKVIEDYPERRPFVKVISLAVNAGVANARNVGLANVSGEYVIHADSDDWVDADMYERLYQKAIESDADIVGCNICHEYSSGTSFLEQNYAETVDDNISRLIRGSIHPSLCTSLTRTSLIKENNLSFLSGLNMGEDLYFNLNLYLYAHIIESVSFAPYHYRHTEDSSSFHHNRSTINSGIEIGRRIEQLMRKEGCYESYADDIEYRKFSLKLPLVKDFNDYENYRYWLKTFPETHRHIWKYVEINWKLRIELWFAAHHMFVVAKSIKNILDLRHRLCSFKTKK